MNFIGKEDKIIRVEENDREMDEATAEAKRTFHFFLDNWQDMKNNGYSVKFGLPTPEDGIEHIWFNPIKIDGDKITAECANNPEKIPDLEVHDIRELDIDLVTDWMILVGNECYGGYTIRVLVERGESEKPPFEFVDLK